MSAIPLLDLAAQHAAVQDEMDAAIARVLAHGKFVSGPEVAEFERAFAAFCRSKHAVGVSSGTDALTVGLWAAGIGRGDEVITTAMTFIATVESILALGATPVLVDPDPDTALLTADAVEAAITERTAAIVPVHLYGQTVDLDAFRGLADRHRLLLAEDAAQAHGAEWNGRRAGSVGDVAAFSFFPGKNLGAIGDAGGLTIQDDGLARRARLLRDNGREDKYRHSEVGTNARLDTLQAAVLHVKLARLEEWNAARRRHAAAYDAAFAEIDGVSPLAVADEATHVYHQYVVRVPDRDRVADGLRERGIGAGVHYPIALHQQPAIAERFADGAFPNAERLADEVLSLPVFPELTEDGRERIVGALGELVADALAARTSAAR
jgi:dTDP-4-amino-4,6-dideoxygalactose transaminase